MAQLKKLFTRQTHNTIYLLSMEMRTAFWFSPMGQCILQYRIAAVVCLSSTAHVGTYPLLFRDAGLFELFKLFILYSFMKVYGKVQESPNIIVQQIAESFRVKSFGCPLSSFCLITRNETISEEFQVKIRRHQQNCASRSTADVRLTYWMKAIACR